MSRHVVRPLGGMLVERVILRYQSIEPPLQIPPRRGIGVLLDEQRSGSVLNEHLAHPRPDRRPPDYLVHGGGDLVETTSTAAHADPFLMQFHCPPLRSPVKRTTFADASPVQPGEIPRARAK